MIARSTILVSASDQKAPRDMRIMSKADAGHNEIPAFALIVPLRNTDTTNEANLIGLTRVAVAGTLTACSV